MISYMNVRLNGRKAVPETIRAGNRGDHMAQGIRFQMPEELAQAQVTLYLEQDGFADAVVLENGAFIPTRTHTSRAGKWNAYLCAVMGEETVWNSDRFTLSIGDLPQGGEQIEQQYPTAIEQAMRAATMIAGTEVEAETLAAGMEASVTTRRKENGGQTLVFGIPKGAPGEKGRDGAVFVPKMSADGVLSWSNDSGLTNPPAVDVLRKAQFAESIEVVQAIVKEAEAAVESVNAAVENANAVAENAHAVVENANAAVEKLKLEAAPVIEATTADEWIRAQDALDAPLRGMKVYGKTVLTGTPSRLSPAQISACCDDGLDITVCGRNLADLPDVTRTSAGYVYQNRAVRLNPGTYVFSCAHDLQQNATWWIALYNAEGVRLNEAFTGTAQQNSAVLHIEEMAVALSVYADAAVQMRCMMLEAGETPGVYEPYAGESLHVPAVNALHGVPCSGGNYSNAAGEMWYADELDVVSGGITRRVCVKVFDGTEWVSVNKANQFYVGLGVRGLVGKTQLCTHFTWGDNDAYKRLKDNSMEARGSNMWLYSSAFTEPAEVKAFFAQQYAAGTPVTLVYAMETPYEESGVPENEAVKQIHTYKGMTHVTGDGITGVEIAYAADTKTWILNQLAAMVSGLMEV